MNYSRPWKGCNLTLIAKGVKKMIMPLGGNDLWELFQAFFGRKK